MKDLWRTRIENMNKIIGIQKNFGYVLYKTEIKENENECKEYEFREELKKLNNIQTPKNGDIVTIENTFNGAIKYAGIFIDDKILHKENEIEKITKIEDLNDTYSQFLENIILPIQIKYYSKK